jgi:hypothetical protein
MLDRHEKIQGRAYALWEKMGYPHGADWDHWFKAEREVEAELKSKPKTPAKSKRKSKAA